MQTTTIAGEILQLHPDRAIYWSARRILFLADLHLGKGMHFRRAGIPVPRGVSERNFARLRGLIKEFSPTRILLLGDLFHSNYNQVWSTFCEFTAAYPDISFELVPGNHDILPPNAYAEAKLKIQPLILVEGPFSLSHHPLEKHERIDGKYNLCGHVHPCVRLVDTTGNGMKLPSFFFGEHEGILPAFGEFTGCHEVKARVGDKVFVLAEEMVFAV